MPGAIPQIDNGKRPDDPLLAYVHLLPLPSDTPYGNLALKSMKIVMRVDWLNRRIGEVYASYARSTSVDPLVAAPLDQQMIAEEVVYWIRKTADELIGLWDFMLQAVDAGVYPTGLRVDCIGSALANHNPKITGHLAGFEVSLGVLNEVSNAYKHSFINSDITFFGRDEPVVVALAVKYNRLDRSPQFHAVTLSDVVAQFSEFYKRALESIGELSAQIKAKNGATNRGPA